MLDIEVANKNVIKELGLILLLTNFSDTHFVLQKSTKRFDAQEICTKLCGTVDVSIVVILQFFFLGL